MCRRGIGGRKRSGRGGVALALVLAMLFGAPAIADKVPPGWDQWDYWGRSRPLPIYRLVWSADDGVCKRIVKALNGAGPSPASLYGNPIFLRWQRYPVDMRRNEFDQTFGKWMEVPFFNDGKPAIALKLIYPGGYNADEGLYVFEDLPYYESKEWVTPQLWKDPRILRPLEPYVAKSFDSFIALPKAMNDYQYWSLMWLGRDIEVNIAKLNGRFYSVMREPSLEVVLVLLFSADREGRAVCVIAPKRPHM